MLLCMFRQVPRFDVIMLLCMFRRRRHVSVHAAGRRHASVHAASVIHGGSHWAVSQELSFTQNNSERVVDY